MAAFWLLLLLMCGSFLAGWVSARPGLVQLPERPRVLVMVVVGLVIACGLRVLWLKGVLL